MARTSSGPSFAERVDAAGLSPQQRETAAPILLLAELVDELCGLTARQVAQLDEQNDRLAEQNELLADLRDGRRGERTARRAASGPTDEGKEGGKVRITEPATPPPDPDEGPASGEPAGGDRTVAEPATGPAAARGTPAKKTASKAAPAKKTTTAARRPGGASGKG
jgi:hypothetical protein